MGTNASHLYDNHFALSFFTIVCPEYVLDDLVVRQKAPAIENLSQRLPSPIEVKEALQICSMLDSSSIARCCGRWQCYHTWHLRVSVKSTGFWSSLVTALLPCSDSQIITTDGTYCDPRLTLRGNLGVCPCLRNELEKGGPCKQLNTEGTLLVSKLAS